MMNQQNTRTRTRTRRLNRPRVWMMGIAVFTLLAALLWQAPARATEGDHTRDLIRAAMVYNFCKFVDWPAEKEGPSLVLGVLSDPLQAPDFSSIDGKRVQDRSLQVRHVSSRQELAGCDLVFIDEQIVLPLADVLADTAQEQVLTISEMDDFCVSGGIIQMVPRRGKMRFFINREAAGDAGLVLSSQLLKMARIVEGD